MISVEQELDDSPEGLRIRLDIVNRHFRRKAGAVLHDKDAVLFLARLYKGENIPLDEFDEKRGIQLAKLASANFVDVGSEYIYITPAGWKFIHEIASE